MNLFLALVVVLAILLLVFLSRSRVWSRRLVHQRRLRVDRYKLRKKHAEIRLDVFSDRAVVDAIRKYAKDHRVTVESAHRQAQLYLTEIVPKFNLLAYYRVGAPLARAMLNFLYRVVVERRPLRELQAESQRSDAVYVYIINHRSNVDYVLVAHMLFKFVSLSYAVGEWARVWPLNHLFKWFGGYFVRRRYREPLYHAVLRAFVQTITRHGVTQGIFIEGGLTRDGAFRKPKLGMLDYMITSKADSGFIEPLYLIPTAINYDRILEDRSLTDECLGKEDRATKWEKLRTTTQFLFKNTFRSIRGRFKRYGNAVVSFGEPILVDELVEKDPRLLSAEFETRKPALAAVADLVMTRISEAIPVTPVAVVASIFADADPNPLPEDEILERVAKMKSDDATRAWFLSDPQHLWDAARQVLELRHLIERAGDGWRWAPGEELLRGFYANSLVPYHEVKSRGWEEPVRGDAGHGVVERA